MLTTMPYREIKETPTATAPISPAADLRQQEAECNITMVFIRAGKATFTVANNAGSHYTYKVTRKDPNAGSKYAQYGPTYFVALLTGPDNSRDYTYMGMLSSYAVDGQTLGGLLGDDVLVDILKLTRASKLSNTSVPVRVFNFAMRVLAGVQSLPAGYSIQHDGLCGRCGRHLTDPESLRTGMGPICRGDE